MDVQSLFWTAVDFDDHYRERTRLPGPLKFNTTVCVDVWSSV